MAERRAPEDYTESDIAQVAMRLLARREYARKELESRLLSRGMQQGLVATVLDRLETDDFLSDERFAESFVGARIGRGQGPFRIRHELEERGVATDLIESAMVEADPDWQALASEVRRKRFGPEPPGDFKQRARQTRFLRYRGFEAEQIRRALGQED